MDQSNDLIRLLGPIAVQVGGEPIQHFRSHKTLAILTYLIVERRPVARDYLAAVFWPDASLEQGRGHVRRALYDLTHKLFGRILIDHHVAEFNRTFIHMVDLFQFDQLAAFGNIPSLETAAALCRGEFLEGMSISGCPIFEEWLMAERESWRRKSIATLNALLNHYQTEAQFGPALDIAWQLVRLQPWNEDRYRQLMILLVRNGDPSHALKVFKRCRHILSEELGEEPSDQILALTGRIRQLIRQLPTNIAGKDLPFIGRKQELALINRLLSSPESRLITITGPGGIGKSCLAIRAGIQANGSSGYLFLDGVYLVRLETVRTADALIVALADALRITSGHKPVSRKLLLRFLQDKEMLLILDDLDLPTDQLDVINMILAAATSVKLMITSLNRLRLTEEWTIPLQGLATEKPSGDGGLSEAMELYLSRLRQYGKYELSASEKISVEQICQTVEGMPLAIELAAGWMQTADPEANLATTEQAINSLITSDTRVPRHTSILRAIEYTWLHLNEQERESLLGLSIFSENFTAETAGEVARVSPSILDGLVDRALVGKYLYPQNGAQITTYHVHPLIRRYSYQKLLEDPPYHNLIYQAYEAHLLRQLSQDHSETQDNNELLPHHGVFE